MTDTRTDVERYGSHERLCRATWVEREACTCGYDDAVARAREAQTEEGYNRMWKEAQAAQSERDALRAQLAEARGALEEIKEQEDRPPWSAHSQWVSETIKRALSSAPTEPATADRARWTVTTSTTRS